MDKKDFTRQFGENLKRNIAKHFKTQKDFAEFFDELTTNVSRWCRGESLPDLFKIYKICKSMGITIDYLVNGEPEGITCTTIDYNIFEEVVCLTNDFAKEINIKVSGKQYLAVYENIVNLKHLNNNLKTKEIFELLRPTLNTWKK